jgi:hypothetical protein
MDSLSRQRRFSVNRLSAFKEFSVGPLADLKFERILPIVSQYRDGTLTETVPPQ